MGFLDFTATVRLQVSPWRLFRFSPNSRLEVPERATYSHSDLLGARITFEGQFKGSQVFYLDFAGFNFIVFGQLQGEDGASAPLAPTLQTRFGVDHFGFAVDDLPAAVADLKAKGVTILEEPWSPRPGLKICYLQEPDQVRIELSERKPISP